MSDNKKEPIPYLPPSTPCTLVGVTVTPNHSNSAVLETFQRKIAKYCTRIVLCPLPLQDVLKGYLLFWWPLLKYMAPILSLDFIQSIL